MRPVFVTSLLLGVVFSVLCAVATLVSNFLILAGTMSLFAVLLTGTYAIGALGIRKGERTTLGAI